MSETIQAELQKARDRGRDRVKVTGEIFTPTDLCKQMIREVPEEKLRDPDTTYLDNSCGDGNFLVSLLEVLTEEYGHDRQHVLNHQLYGVDLMPDNVATVKRRLGLTEDMPGWDHIICADALAYDYSFVAQSQSSMVEEVGAR